MTTQTQPAATDIRCLRCKERTPSKDVTPYKMANGKDAIRAVCVKCGNSKHRFGKLPAEAGAAAA